MKIGLISPTIYRLKEKYDSYGGIEPLVGNLAMALANRGNEVVVFAPKGSYLGDKVKIVETVEANLAYNYGHESLALNVVSEYLKTNQLDIIHDHTHQKYVYLYKKDHPEQKVCSTLHNQTNFNSKPPGVQFMNLMGISNFHCMEASGILGMHLERVYNGIELSKYPYIEEKDDYFIFLSRISRFKGAHEAIEAAKQTNINLKIVGEDVFVQDPAYVLSVMQSCDGKKIKYFGHVSEDKKLELLSKAKALILPLLWNEPMGLVAIEAMACGTPVITTPRGAMPELIEHRKTGYLCSNFEEIKSGIKLIDIIKPIDCQTKANRFGLDTMVDNYYANYERILKGEEW